MLAVVIILVLLFALVYVSFERGVERGISETLRIEVRGRALAAEEGREYDPAAPCGEPACDFPLCSLDDDSRARGRCYLSHYRTPDEIA